MCGVAGILTRAADRPVDGSTLRAMADRIAHRGPDAAGYWSGRGVGLAHRRLSIIDLAGGDQPMANEDGSVRVVFNGEVYNYPRLREELLARGHTLRTRSDTEVLVHLYEDHGVDLVHHLRGMFAFALWDDRQKRLVLARDRVGLKPLYYTRDRERLLFASELKALEVAGVDRTIDPEGLEAYLALGFLPGERTILRGVKKLAPGCTLVVDQHDLLANEPRRYWRLTGETDTKRSADEWVEEVRAKFAETVAAHRLADVPVGAFLSGGVDSGAVVAELATQGESVTTFSIGFEDERLSELSLARRVAERYGTDHVERVVTADAARGLDQLVEAFDEPFADPSAVPTLAVARVAAERVKVVLSGDGGDEAFGGYRRYAHDLREDAVRSRLPRWLRRGVLRHVAAAWPHGARLPRPLRAKTALTNLSLDAAEAYANTVSLFRPDARRRLLGPTPKGAWRPESVVAAAYDDGARGDALRGMTRADTAVLLPDDFLVKVDRASMAVGLEVRPPLVDHEFLELAATIPSSLKVRGGETKWLFKRAQQDRLPEEVVWGKKRGFDVPLDAWLKSPLRDRVEAAVAATGPLAGLVDTAEAGRLAESQRRGAAGAAKQLWALVVLAEWFDRRVASPAPRASHPLESIVT